jgi:hypothetical protein
MRTILTTLAQNLGIGPPSFFVKLEGYGAITIDGLTIPNPAPTNIVSFNAVAVDETDIGWWGNCSVGTINPTITDIAFTNTSRFGSAIKKINGGGGTGYSIAPQVTISGDGAGARAIAIMNGNTIDHFEMIAGGFGYTVATISVTGGGGAGGSGAAILAPLGVGDYFVWNDEYNYEICQIIGIDQSTGHYIISRGLFGSTIVAHNCDLFRLVSTSMSRPIGSAIGAQKWKFLWDNMCVCAVSGRVGASAPLTILLTPTGADGINKARPGLRTMGGAAYTNLGVLGTLTLGQTAISRVSIQAWETIRCVYAKVSSAPIGADLIINVVYIAADGVSCGLVDQVTIPAGSFCSYNVLTPPDGQQMPYHTNWNTLSPHQLDWPPNKLTKLTSALDSNGNLQLPITQDPTNYVIFAPDGSTRGSLDFIISQIGSSVAGSNLVVTVQT